MSNRKVHDESGLSKPPNYRDEWGVRIVSARASMSQAELHSMSDPTDLQERVIMGMFRQLAREIIESKYYLLETWEEKAGFSKQAFYEANIFLIGNLESVPGEAMDRARRVITRLERKGTRLKGSKRDAVRTEIAEEIAQVLANKDDEDDETS